MDFAKGGIGPDRYFEKLRSQFEEFESRFFFRHQRTYIVPTGFGIAFGVVALILLMLAVGYSNNLIYLFVFFLISMAISGMWWTNQNMDNLQFISLSATNLFADQDNAFQLILRNQSRTQTCHDLQGLVAKSKLALPSEITSIPAQREMELSVSWRPPRRGWTLPPRIHLQSSFPFGMFRAWKTLKPEKQLLVYPAAKGVYEFPPQQSNDGKQSAEMATLGLFRDHREFQNFDSPRRIDWRSSAKHQKLLVKNYEEFESEGLVLDWTMTDPDSSFEDRISQLCLWIEKAFSENLYFKLKIGGFESLNRSGPEHRHHCLKKLALLAEKDL